MITVYSKNGCPRCDEAKRLLEILGYEYQEIRIDQDDEARNFLINEGHKSVPQIYYERTLLVENGYFGLANITAKQIQQRINEINEN